MPGGIREQEDFAVYFLLIFFPLICNFLGNTIKKIVESRNEIAALMPNENGIRTIWGQLLFNFRMLLRLSAAGEFNLDGLGLKRLREHCSAAFWNFQVCKNKKKHVSVK